jgi:hypothetical protein
LPMICGTFKDQKFNCKESKKIAAITEFVACLYF